MAGTLRPVPRKIAALNERCSSSLRLPRPLSRLGESLPGLAVAEKSAVRAGRLERGGVKFWASTVDGSPPIRGSAWTGRRGHGWQRPRSGATGAKSLLELPVIGRWISRWISLWITMWITRRSYCHPVRWPRWIHRRSEQGRAMSWCSGRRVSRET